MDKRHIALFVDDGLRERGVRRHDLGARNAAVPVLGRVCALEPAARLPYLEKKKAERLKIQSRIKDLTEKRDAFVRAEMDKQQLDDSRALDRVLKDAIREQAAEGGFEFEK